MEDDCEVEEEEAEGEDEGPGSIWGNSLRESIAASVLMLKRPDRFLLSSLLGIGEGKRRVQGWEDT